MEEIVTFGSIYEVAQKRLDPMHAGNNKELLRQIYIEYLSKRREREIPHRRYAYDMFLEYYKKVGGSLVLLDTAISTFLSDNILEKLQRNIVTIDIGEPVSQETPMHARNDERELDYKITSTLGGNIEDMKGKYKFSSLLKFLNYLGENKERLFGENAQVYIGVVDDDLFDVIINYYRSSFLNIAT